MELRQLEKINTLTWKFYAEFPEETSNSASNQQSKYILWNIHLKT